MCDRTREEMTMERMRRIVSIGIAGVLITGSFAGATERASLVVASFGGAWQEAQREAMFDPFAEEHGITVVGVEYGGDYELIREKGGAGEWDVVDVEPVELLRGAAEGIYEEIDYSGIDRDALLESAVHPYGVGLMTYSIVLGYDTRRFGGDGEVPRTWADFWDVERFPGKRALRDDPQWMFEIALMADGVPPAELYPIDVDRALASLGRIEGHVVAFEAWSEPAELLAGGEVALAVGTDGRLLAAKEEGKPVDLSWHGGLVASDYFVIPKGSRNKQAAQKLVAYAVSVAAQSRIPEYIDYGPVNRRALDLVPEEVLPHLATYPPNLEQAVIFQADWWLEHKEEAVRRYREWLRPAEGQEEPE